MIAHFSQRIRDASDDIRKAKATEERRKLLKVCFGKERGGVCVCVCVCVCKRFRCHERDRLAEEQNIFY